MLFQQFIFKLLLYNMFKINFLFWLVTHSNVLDPDNAPLSRKPTVKDQNFNLFSTTDFKFLYLR